MPHTPDAHDLADVATELQDEPAHNTTQAIVERALEFIPHAGHASLTIRTKGRRHQTLASTSTLAAALDELQYELGEGPCVDSADHGEWFRSGDAGHDRRWPHWGPRAARKGLHSLLTIRLLSQGEPVGALNLYSERAGMFADPDEVEAALLFATHAAHALVSARLVTDLENALVSRHQIGVAQGIIMQRYGISLDDSFSLLRRQSQDLNVKLRELARQVVQHGDVPQTAPED